MVGRGGRTSRYCMYMDQVYASSCEEQALLGYLRTVNDEKGRDKTETASDLASPYRNLFPAVSGTTWYLYIHVRAGM